MSERVKKIIFVPVLIVILGMLGYFLLAAVYALPTDRIEANVQSSAFYFEREGNYPRLMQSENSQLDNFTDALMLLTASHPNKENAWHSAINAVRYNVTDEKSADTLVNIYLNGATGIPEESYARYWHGYLVFLKPLLSIMDYGQIRSLMMCVQLAIFMLVLLELYNKKRELIIPIFVAWIFMNPISTMLSLQYHTVLTISFIATWAILKLSSRWNEDNLYAWSILFMIIGALTSYFDLLTYPLVALGIPLISWISLYLSEKVLTNIYRIIRMSAFWAVGYGGMWAFKWILGSVITGENVIGNAIDSAVIRSSADVSDTAISYISVLQKQIISAHQDSWRILVICAAAVYLFCLIRRKKINWNVMITLAFIAVFPLVWYFVLQNHSYIHSFFTYREFAISIYAFLACIMLYIGERKNG